MRLAFPRATAFAAGLFITAATSLPALAMGDWPQEPQQPSEGTVTHVPEIDAGAGIAALTAVGAMLALAWERRRN